tara:strand:- start:20006 stop:20290 length:285 start_codon:yes stop_codon:yes gene_type:complete
MDNTALPLTTHAGQRAAERAVPIAVVKMILEYGESQNAHDGARKYALSKASLRNLRQDFGATFSNSMSKFRKAYVVSSNGAVITVAFAHHPLFH